MTELLQRLQDPARSGVYRVENIGAFAPARFDVVSIALASSKEAMLEQIAHALAFPAWFGKNWDALEDCLADLSWREGEGPVLLFTAFTPSDELGILVDVLRSCAEGWAQRGKPFFAVFVDPQRRLKLPELK